MRIEEEFGCVGYYGFGGGVDMHRRPDRPKHGEPVYCVQCRRSGDCWTKHRERMRALVPDLMKIIDDLVATGLRGPEVVIQYQARLTRETGVDSSNVAPPELHAMLGNMEDGALVAAGQAPKDRGRMTLVYPFEA